MRILAFDLQGGRVRVSLTALLISALMAATLVGATPITVRAAAPDKLSVIHNLTSATMTVTTDPVAPTVVRTARTTKPVTPAVKHRRAAAPASCGCSAGNSGERPRTLTKMSTKRLTALLAHAKAKKRLRYAFDHCRDNCRDDTIICLIAAGLLCEPCALACLIGEALCLKDCNPEEN
jgi:hypothetical protein